MTMDHKTKDYLLLLDTATEVCSVALGRRDGTIVGEKEEHLPNKHSELLASFSGELLGLLPGGAAENLGGIVISAGPGSYTGLRIGASYAKGLSWTLGIPLAAIPTTEALALRIVGSPLLAKHPDALLLPMIDARRMEVYAAFYTSVGRIVQGSDIRALVLTDDADLDYLKASAAGREILYFGSGAAKAVPVMEELYGNKALFVPDITAGAGAMLGRGIERIEAGETVQPDYWTPLYLKEFQATTPKKH